MANFEKELTDLLNRASAENESNTPDFILAKYLLDCLTAFDLATNERQQWFIAKFSKELEEYCPYEGVLTQTILDMKLTIRSTNCLKNENIRFVGDLIKCTESELMQIPNLGKGSFIEIKQTLGKWGLSLIKKE